MVYLLSWCWIASCLIVLCCSVTSGVESVTVSALNHAFCRAISPVDYDLGLRIFSGCGPDSEVLVCLHGSGSDSSTADVIASSEVTPYHILGFNLPPCGVSLAEELLPALWILRQVVVEAGASALSLYGFSAGGGTLVDLVAVLNRGSSASLLQAAGITVDDRRAILVALQKGHLYLDAPLKSLDEVYEAQGISRARSFRDRRPIDALSDWSGLALNVSLFFQCPDESLGNRDDALFIERLRTANVKGTNRVTVADAGGHCAFHTALWDQ